MYKIKNAPAFKSNIESKSLSTEIKHNLSIFLVYCQNNDIKLFQKQLTTLTCSERVVNIGFVKWLK